VHNDNYRTFLRGLPRLLWRGDTWPLRMLWRVVAGEPEESEEEALWRMMAP
jgi:hypothetical protein